MGNTQGRSPPAAANLRHKSPRSGKYPVSQTKNSLVDINGSGQQIANNGGPSRPKRNAAHQPRVEFDIPDFLQEKERKRSQSPVIQRHLGDPDPIIVEQESASLPKRGLLIPKSELQVPDFLRNAQPNGKVSFADNNARPVGVPKNRPSGVHRSKPVGAIRTPGNLRNVYASVGMNTSHQQVNIDSDSKRHGSAAQESVGKTLWAKASPPRTRGTLVIGSDPLTQQALHSKSMTNLHESKHVNNGTDDITADLVDDFGTFTLQRKYKKQGKRDSRKNNLSSKERLAPGVTGKYAVKPHLSGKSERNGEGSYEGMPEQNEHQWSVTDTDSMQSASSLSFTDPTSPNSCVHRNTPLNQRKGHFQPEKRNQNNGSIHQPEGNESPDSALGYVADLSFGNQDSSVDEGKNMSRKNSLQAHLRYRVKEYERMNKETSRHYLRAHYDSDATTISDQSVFGDGMSSVTRFSASSIGHINNLQDDLLLRIFSYLTTLDLCKTSSVCRKWQDLAWDPILWSSIEITGYEESDINRILRNLLTTLAMSTQGYCLTVRHIKLNGCELVSDKSLELIAKYCIDLEELQIGGCCCITSKGLQDILLKCHSLHHLNLSGCTCVNSICVPNFNGFSIGDHGSFLKLRHLDMSDCVAFDDFGLRTIGLSCGLLETLYLRRCSCITDVGMKHIANHCHNLKELSTSDCFKIRDFSLKEIARNIPGLKYLGIAKCPVSNTGIKYIGRHCVRLKYLNVRGCDAITDVGIAYIVQNCLKLRSLDIGKCDITDSVMNTIGIHCPQLKKLSVKGCDRISDNGIKSIAAQCCHLQYLNVQECDVSFETFSLIRQQCRNCIIEHTCPAFF